MTRTKDDSISKKWSGILKKSLPLVILTFCADLMAFDRVCSCLSFFYNQINLWSFPDLKRSVFIKLTPLTDILISVKCVTFVTLINITDCGVHQESVLAP